MTDPFLSRMTSDGRYYVHPKTGRRVPSITNIIGIKEKGGIAKWGYRKCGEFVADPDQLAAIVELAKVKGGNRNAIVDLVREAPYRSSNDSANVGDVVHDWIDRHIKGEFGPLVPQAEFDRPFVVVRDTQVFLTDNAAKNARGMWRSFLAVEERYKIKWDMAEVTVWSEKGYAGTMDWIAHIGGTTSCIGDNKTGNNVYKEVAMQVAAGAFADFAFDGQGNQIAIPKAERYAVLHLRPKFGSLIPIDHIEESYQAFLGAMALFNWDVQYDRDDILGVAPKIEVTSTEA